MGSFKPAVFHVRSFNYQACHRHLITLNVRESRDPPIYPLHIALSNFPVPPADIRSPRDATLCHSLRLIVPRYAYHSLDLDSVNKASFVPESKNEDLHAGVLQVPDSTVLLMTEFGINEGRVGEKGMFVAPSLSSSCKVLLIICVGMENIQALHDIISSQVLLYKFPFSHFSFPTNITLMTCTDGKRSLFLKVRKLDPHAD